MASRSRGTPAAYRSSGPTARLAAAARAVSSCATVSVEPLEDRKLFAVTLISVGLGGAPANGESGEASVSQNGNLVAFSSKASNLANGDTNGRQDVFLRNLNTGTTTQISKNPGTGAVGDGDSYAPQISADGRFVVFASRATNLIANDTLGFSDVFRYNVQTGALQLVSASDAAGNTFIGGNSGEPSVSADGQFVSFTTFGLIGGFADGNGENDVYRRDMNSGALRLVSVRNGQTTQGSGDKLSFDSQISADGRFVSFRSDASNLVAPGVDVNNARDTFVRDLQDNTTKLVSINLSGTSGNEGSTSNAVSGNGRFVTFRSRAADLVNNDTNNTDDVFLRDTVTGQTRLLSINRLGTASARGPSEFPWLSSDGSFAAFSSPAPDLVENDGNARQDVFLRDLNAGPITLLSATPSGTPGNGNSYDPFVSSDARFIVFSSLASDLAGNDGNGQADVFLATAPTPAEDHTPPTAVVSANQEPANPGAAEYRFNIDLADNQGLNTVNLGPLTVTRGGGSPVTATFVGVVGSGRSAVATYSMPVAGGLSSANDGTYTVTTQANSIRDAAGNAVAAGANIGSFTLAVGAADAPDLVGTIVAKLPTTVQLGGSKKGKAAVRIVNSGTQPMTTKVPVTTQFFLSDNQTLDSFDTQVAQVTKPMKLKVNKAKNVKAKFTYPTNIGDGGFFLLAKVDTQNNVAERVESNNVSVGSAAIPVEQPRIDLSGTIQRPGGNLKPGGSGFTKVTINNSGNVPFKGALRLVVSASTDNVLDNGNDRELVTVTPRVTVNPAGGKQTTVKFNIPSDLAPGDYFLTVKIDPQNAVVEPNDADNFALTTAPFTLSA